MAYLEKWAENWWNGCQLHCPQCSCIRHCVQHLCCKSPELTGHRWTHFDWEVAPGCLFVSCYSRILFLFLCSTLQKAAGPYKTKGLFAWFCCALLQLVSHFHSYIHLHFLILLTILISKWKGGSLQRPVASIVRRGFSLVWRQGLGLGLLHSSRETMWSAEKKIAHHLQLSARALIATTLTLLSAPTHNAALAFITLNIITWLL